MPLYEFEGTRPTIADDAFIADTATIIGDVTVEAGASVWYGAVLRSDYAPIVIRAGANVQENSLLHGPTPIEVGPGATVGHLCVVHGATIGEEALIANGATVLDGATIGARAMVGAGAVVSPGTKIPAGMLAVGVPAKVKGPLEGTPAQFWVDVNPGAYQELAARYRAGVKRL